MGVIGHRRWARRSRDAHASLKHAASSEQLLFGIVQGSTYPALRRKSAQQITSLGFDGFTDAYSGKPVGGSSSELLLWGVYEDLPPGKYVVVYRVQAMSNVTGTNVCLLDLAHSGKTMASRRPAASEFQPGKWTNIPVPLTLNRVWNTEYRLWPNKAKIALDRIYVFRYKD